MDIGSCLGALEPKRDVVLHHGGLLSGFEDAEPYALAVAQVVDLLLAPTAVAALRRTTAETGPGRATPGERCRHRGGQQPPYLLGEWGAAVPCERMMSRAPVLQSISVNNTGYVVCGDVRLDSTRLCNGIC